jgi:hypothetical protein
MGIYLLLIIFVQFITSYQRKEKLLPSFTNKKVYIRWAVYYALVMCIIYTGVFEHKNFIYFQF